MDASCLLKLPYNAAELQANTVMLLAVLYTIDYGHRLTSFQKPFPKYEVLYMQYTCSIIQVKTFINFGACHMQVPVMPACM